MNEKNQAQDRFPHLQVNLSTGKKIALFDNDGDVGIAYADAFKGGAESCYLTENGEKTDKELFQEASATAGEFCRIVETQKNAGGISADSAVVIIATKNTPYASIYRRIELRLDNFGVKHWRADVAGKYGNLQASYDADAESTGRAIVRALSPGYEVDSLSNESYLDNVLQEFSDTTPPVKTGFPALDSEIGGGLHPWLYVLGGVSSTGKTTFALQIADNVARAGGYALIFSAEMSRAELIARSISRETAGGATNRLTQIAVQSGAIHTIFTPGENEAYRKAVERYRKYAGRVSVVENAGGNLTPESIYRFVENYVFKTGRKPLVIVDYLQILPPDDSRADTRAAVNAAMSALVAVKVKFGVPVLLISALNRENYTTQLNLASFKESGAIEYGADVLLGLQFSIMREIEKRIEECNKKSGDRVTALDLIQEEKAKDVRDVEIVVLKNRTGKSSASVLFDYEARYNCFTERKPGHKYAPCDAMKPGEKW